MLNLDIKVATVITARNEEKSITATLESLEQQILKPYRVVVVNDGSTDSTADVVSKFRWVELINRPVRNESYLHRKELAETVNVGLDIISKDTTCDYVCISGADILYPRNYIHTLATRMDNNPLLAVTSGIIQDEYSTEPRGAGRVVRCEFWKKIGFRYPINYGYEGYLLSKARSMGYQNTVYDDIIMRTQRQTGENYTHATYYSFGLGMRALGYKHTYALARIFLLSIKNPVGAFHMCRGYYSRYVDLYEEDLRKYVQKTQSDSRMISKFFATLSSRTNCR